MQTPDQSQGILHAPYSSLDAVSDYLNMKKNKFLLSFPIKQIEW